MNISHEKSKKELINFFVIVLLFLLVVYIFISPNKSGIFGIFIYNILYKMLGTASYMLPFAFLIFFKFIDEQFTFLKIFQQAYKTKYYFGTIIFCSCFFSYLKYIFKYKYCGGWIGDKLFFMLKTLFGILPSFIMIIILFFIFLLKFFEGFVFYFIYKIKKKNEIKLINYKKDSNIVVEKTTKNIANNNNSKIPNNINSNQYILPNIELLEKNKQILNLNKNELIKKSRLLENTLQEFGINAKIKDIIPGPIITRYDLTLAPGIRIQTISNITDNIALTMKTSAIRIVPIPEKSVIGIEVRNNSGIIVNLREVIDSGNFENSRSPLTLALGKTIDGLSYITDLITMPHMLIAGTTGSGKSIGIHSIIISILYKAYPNEVKLMLIDPKRVEMLIYKNIPHLYNPCTSSNKACIITNPKEAVIALKKLSSIMDDRYSKFAKEAVRNIEEYNNKMVLLKKQKEFYIVTIIDEFADLMLVAQKETEHYIQRLSQMARAVGIHLILSTQRPSVNIITGTIKANLPARLSFQTASKIDSRVILDSFGAENLVGNGDLLFLPPGENRPIRLQGTYVSPMDLKKIISFINKQGIPKVYEQPKYIISNKNNTMFKENKVKDDFIKAVKLINERKRISQDLLKANLGSSSKASNILSILEIKKFIMKPNGTNKWKINHEKIFEFLNKSNKEDN
ncbi:MAG: DNA translocase FtsK [Endomicrobium sp.]|jgi:S-DNA-T family DNA segregation ATPase FtsK/SpoIIIE|nr:DNA translocase FtsK [Endomicrobium sp.]